MTEAIWGAARALGAYAIALDVVAGNLANLSTPGFSPQRTLFAELLGELTTRPPGYLGTPGSLLEPLIDRPERQGSPVATGRRGDWAIVGRGYFVLRLGDGRTAYSRNGAFTLDAGGRLVGPGGAWVLRDGTGGPEPLEAGREDAVPAVRAFANPAGLFHLGAGLYLATESSGPPQPAPDSRVLPGHLEMGGTDLAVEMAALMAAQRAFQLVVRSLDAQDQMLALANRLRDG